MGSARSKETCGRCSFSTVVEAVEDRKNKDGSDTERYDPYDGTYIEVDERELKLVSAPAVYAGQLKRWLDELAFRIIYN